MKKNIYFLFLITIFLILTMSCETFNSAQGIKTSKEHKRKADISIPFDEYLAERVWRLAGCYFENGHYVQLDANLTESRINFFSDGKFEATTGITNYKGTLKHKKIEQKSHLDFK